MPEFEEGIPFNPLVGMMIAHSNVTRDTIATDQLKPTPSQYSINVGAKALMAGSHSDLDQDLTVLEVLDPTEYSNEYPDWSERLQNSYLLCRWKSEHDQEGDVGWFSRVKLIEVTDEQYVEVTGWVEGSRPEEMPKWLIETYDEYTEELAKQSPNKIPRIATCGVCGSKKVALVVEHTTNFAVTAGEITIDGETYTVPMGEAQHDCTSSGKLCCVDCNSWRHLESGEIKIQPGTRLAQILGHH